MTAKKGAAASPKKPAKKAAKESVKKSPKSAKGAKSDIKRPKSAYLFFSMEARPEILKKNPKLSATDVMKEVGALWSKKAEKDRTPYVKMSDDDKKRYETEKAKAK